MTITGLDLAKCVPGPTTSIATGLRPLMPVEQEPRVHLATQETGPVPSAPTQNSSIPDSSDAADTGAALRIIKRSEHSFSNASGANCRETVIVRGPLALRMRHTTAARHDELGLEVTTLSAMAARLAGGFKRPAALEDVLSAITTALTEVEMTELGSIAALPGTPRAVARTLGNIWLAGTDLTVLAPTARVTDLAALEARVREALPPGVLVPPDLRDAALTRIHHAPAVLGTVKLEGALDVEPVWRPLLVELAALVPLSWTTRGDVDRSWFPGPIKLVPPVGKRHAVADACADPQAEAVEALRWARALLARRNVAACDVAIATTSTAAYDVFVPALAREAGLPLHSTHGVRALDSRDGQACAALADALLRGPTQERVRRLLRRVDVPGIPRDWSRGLPRGALLANPQQWRQALERARSHDAVGQTTEQALLDLVHSLSRGLAAARELGEQLLKGGARRLWRNALIAAPAAALELALGELRVSDAAEPGACISWGPAAHLAAAPRPYVRLLGLTARDWPRSAIEDPLSPTPSSESTQDIIRRDLLHYEVIAGAATGELALSRPRRSTESSPLPQSRLWPPDGQPLSRGRIPIHALGEADRLLARPSDAQLQSRIASGLACWHAWRQAALTPYDGLVPTNDPLVTQALVAARDVASLSRLLRDPMAFLLLDVLGLRSLDIEAVPLAIGPRAKGELIHEILRRATDALEASTVPVDAEDEAAAIETAKRDIFEEWPRTRAVPPPLPWRYAVDEAAGLALLGMQRMKVAAGTTRWSEVPFGKNDHRSGRVPLGWDLKAPVMFGGLQVGGRIDRVDLQSTGSAARVIDWKTGDPPPEGVELCGGMELQRAVYATAVTKALPHVKKVEALIAHLGPPFKAYRLSVAELENCQAALEQGLAVATSLAREGMLVPGAPAREETFDPIRLALPADLEGWLSRKAAAFDVAWKRLRPVWDHR